MGQTGINGMHTEILSDRHLELLQWLSDAAVLPGAYMAGGTALALQTGWRMSVDFDFFTQGDFDPYRLSETLRQAYEHDFTVRRITDGTCDVVISGIQVSFFRYPYKLLRPPRSSQAYPGIRLASVEDIACMKVIAVGQRGARKDFFDLYQILTTFLTMEELAAFLKEKYGPADFSYTYMGMTYFDDAEKESLGQVFVPYDWEEIKRYFLAEAPRFNKALTENR